MNKWSEIKQATLDKLFMDEKEAEQQNYLSKFQHLANECLNGIANGVKPRIVRFSVGVYNNVIEGSDFKYDSELGFVTYNQNGILAEIVPDNTTAYVDGDSVYCFDNGLKLINNNKVVKLGDVISMPTDFLSFADMLVLHNNAPYDDVVYLGDRDIVVGEIGTYLIYYNGLWETITEEHVDPSRDKVLNIDLSVLNCLPAYIASKVLAQDDIQRSAMLNNEYELSLSRLDTNIMYQSNSFRSSGGWY